MDWFDKKGFNSTDPKILSLHHHHTDYVYINVWARSANFGYYNGNWRKPTLEYLILEVDWHLGVMQFTFHYHIYTSLLFEPEAFKGEDNSCHCHKKSMLWLLDG